MVTGGAGSIGSNIVRVLLNYNPEVIRVLDNNETALFNFQNELKDFKNVRFLIGDVRSKNRLKKAMENIDIVFHTAALKHVPLCEYNPFEAVETNVIGTQNVIDAAMNEEVEKVISISTDKAVNPINTMGATKLLCEKLVATANYYKGKRKTIFSSVRFGNVLASRGSVIPIFKKQIQSGGPVTLTDTEMTRFFMSMNQAIELTLKATEIAIGGEIFIFKMPTVKILDLAQVMIEELAPKFGFKPSDIEIKKIGIRPGEKLNEELIGMGESGEILETDNMYIIMPRMIAASGPRQDTPEQWKNFVRPVSKRPDGYSSKNGLIGKDDVKKILKMEKIV